MQTNPDTHAAQPAIGLIALARLALAALSKPISGRTLPAVRTTRSRATEGVDPAGSSALAPDADAQIRSTLLAALAQQPWWQAKVSNVFVLDGVVIFQGLVQRAYERHAAHVVAQAIAGVRAIRDDRIRAREWQAMA